MKYNSNSYTEYPMLRPYSDDYPHGGIRTDLCREMRDESIVIECRFDVNEPSVSKSVKEGYVGCCLLVYCSATCYTELFRGQIGENVVTAEIPYELLNGRIEAHPSVITLRETVLLTKTAHPEYRGALIPVERYKQIAASEPWVFQVKPAGKIESVFRLEADSSDALRDWEFDFEAEPSERYIVVKANSQTYEHFKGIRHNTDATRATVYLTALTNALAFLDQEPGDNEPPQGWASTVRIKLQELKLDIWQQGHSPGLAAQRLLGEPLCFLESIER